MGRVSSSHRKKQKKCLELGETGLSHESAHDNRQPGRVSNWIPPESNRYRYTNLLLGKGSI
jgi:hypothetical protein